MDDSQVVGSREHGPYVPAEVSLAADRRAVDLDAVLSPCSDLDLDQEAASRLRLHLTAEESGRRPGTDQDGGLSHAWGGLHVAGGSRDVEIRENDIREQTT